jgi:NitT/TauT family transport system substrate-binding protein
MLTRREVLRRGAGIAAGLTAGRWLAAYALAPTRASQLTQSAPLPAPETTTFRIACAPCDAPIMAAERYLREEGFTNIEITDAATGPGLASGRLEMGIMFPPTLANTLQQQQRVVGLAGLHPGCSEIWAQPGIASVKDLRGRTIGARSKVLGDLAYSYMTVVLKHAGVNPGEVNFVVQPDADLVRLYLEGHNDAVFVPTVPAAALRANPANKGHIVHSQIMHNPWFGLDCCLLVTRPDWYRANPVAAKRAVRAIFRAADSQPAHRVEAVKLVTDRGLFGGARNFDNVLEAANMVPANWRELDAERSVRFFGQLLAEVGLLQISVDEMVKALDLRILRELRTELKM